MDHKIEIIERELEGNMMAVDLVVNGQTINTGDNPISSFSFFEDIKKAARRAIFRIKTKNPRLKFDFNLATMALSEEDKNQRLINHIKSQRSDIDVDKAMKIVNDQISKIKPFGPNDDHPNPEFETQINSDLVKILIINSIGEYNKNG